jgi:hypothetical protein
MKGWGPRRGSGPINDQRLAQIVFLLNRLYMPQQNLPRDSPFVREVTVVAYEVQNLGDEVRNPLVAHLPPTAGGGTIA